MKESYKNGILKIDKNWLKFPNNSATLKLSQITDLEVIWNPKRKILISLIVWYILICIIDKFEMDNGWIFLFGFMILFGGIAYIIDSIKFNFNESITALQISMSSGKMVLIHSKNKIFLEDLKETILEAIKTEEEKIEINLNNYGIINIGNNIKNKVIK